MLPEIFIDHLVFRVPDLVSTEKFYCALFGEAISATTSDSLMWRIGETRLFFTLYDGEFSGRYDKEQSCLNHLAFGVREPAHLRRPERISS